MKVRIVGERVTLRSVVEQDCKAIYEYRKDASTNRYQGWIPESEQEVIYKLCGVIDKASPTPSWSQVVICLGGGEIIGDIGYAIDGDSCELGCTLAVAHHGNGYAVTGLRLLIDHLQKNYEIVTFTASIDPRNAAAARLLCLLGFDHVSMTRQAYKIRNEWVDDAVYNLSIP
jgi:RimJ/RimL family protein N-acetyltransferase